MVRVHLNDESLNTTLLLSLDERVKDVFQLLSIKVKGVNSKIYDLRLYNRSLEVRAISLSNRQEVIKEGIILDQETPLKDMVFDKKSKVIEMELTKKPKSEMEPEESKTSDVPRSTSIGGYDVRKCESL